MRLRLYHLQLINKQSIEIVEFAERLSFFHGEMSSGKSSIPALIDFCFGGRFRRTPALSSELVSVQLHVGLGDNDVLIERTPSEANYIQVSWETADGRRFQISAPSRPTSSSQPIYGENVFGFSDLVLALLCVDVIKVRKRSHDQDSSLVRLSFRDILEFVYLNQDHLDSDFFLLDQPIRKEKSQDALRYFVGYMSERLNDLQNEQQELRQQQRSKREAVEQIRAFLVRFDFGSEEKITAELVALRDEALRLEAELARLKDGFQPEAYIADEDRARLQALTVAIAQTTEAVEDLQARIREQESLESEIISLKFKAARTAAAHEVLDAVDFELCPVCGSGLARDHRSSLDHCYLCKTPNAVLRPAEPTAVDVIRQDLDSRIADLKQSVSRHKRAIRPMLTKLEQLKSERRTTDERVGAIVRSYESEYLARSRQHERRLSAIQERSELLGRIRAMPAEIEKVYAEADSLTAKINELRRRIEEEEASLRSAEANLKAIEQNYKNILLAIHFPGFAANDVVVINRRTLIPEILQAGDERRTWNFYDAGSGGKKTLLKICFALALHKTAAENKLPVPRLLMVDSPMKNITPDVNRDVFTNFYGELYRLLATSLADWQVVLIDQTYLAPPNGVQPSTHRLMLRDDLENPPLINYYRGA
jgi:hypothetical protein